MSLHKVAKFSVFVINLLTINVVCVTCIEMAHWVPFSIIFIVFCAKNYILLRFDKLCGGQTILEIFVLQRNDSIFWIINSIFNFIHAAWDLLNGILDEMIQLVCKIHLYFFVNVIFKVFKSLTFIFSDSLRSSCHHLFHSLFSIHWWFRTRWSRTPSFHLKFI